MIFPRGGRGPVAGSRHEWPGDVGGPATYRLVMTDLVRPRHGKIIAGVCAGIARRFGWSPTTVRVVFLLSCLLPGPQVLVYLVLWIVMPKEA